MKRSVVTVCLALLTAFGCGGGGGRANVEAGSMPQGGSYTGVWQSPQYGEMHMLQQGTNVIGRYTKDEREGRIQGTVQGDLMRFEWTERRYMVSNRPTVTRGRGYFKYSIDDSGNHNILGEWGIDDDETGGGEWNAYRMRNRQPDIDQSGNAGGENEYDEIPDDGEELEPVGDGEPEDTGDDGGGGGGDSTFDDLEL